MREGAAGEDSGRGRRGRFKRSKREKRKERKRRGKGRCLVPPRCAPTPYTSRLRCCRGCGDLWKEEGGGESPAPAPPLPRLHGATPWDARGPGRRGPGFHRTRLTWEGDYWDLLMTGQAFSCHSPHLGPLRRSRVPRVTGSTHPPPKVPFKFENSDFPPDRDLGKRQQSFEPNSLSSMLLITIARPRGRSGLGL